MLLFRVSTRVIKQLAWLPLCTVKRSSVNVIWRTCYQLQCYSESPFLLPTFLLVWVKVDYVSGNVLMNDSHSDSKFWVTIWSYLLLTSILV